MQGKGKTPHESHPTQKHEPKQTAEDDSSEYYTVQEAMKKYNLTRDSVYGILQFHEIKREKKGRFVRFLKVEFDHVMGVRK